MGKKNPRMAWEVDWSHEENTGTRLMARNTKSHLPSARSWSLRLTGYLRTVGVNTATYRADSWEVDWEKRNGKKVLARNRHSKMPSAREWHYVDMSTLVRVGTKWKPKKPVSGRFISNGYVRLNRRGMTDEEIALAKQHDLFMSTRAFLVMEHQLVAVKKYGSLPDGMVVRHVNGVKSDNRPENLLLGTTKENTLDHVTARMSAMYWRERCERAENELQKHGIAMPAEVTEEPK